MAAHRIIGEQLGALVSDRRGSHSTARHTASHTPLHKSHYRWTLRGDYWNACCRNTGRARVAERDAAADNGDTGAGHFRVEISCRANPSDSRRFFAGKSIEPAGDSNSGL